MQKHLGINKTQQRPTSVGPAGAALHRLAANADYALDIVDFSGTTASVAVCDSKISRRERPGGACLCPPFKCHPISAV